MDYRDIRRMFKAGDDVRDAGLVTPPDVVRFDDICYGPHGRENTLDVYRPRAAGEDTLPCIVSVHGGGWVYGDKERYQYYCMDLARRGFAVVNFTYRLAPEHPFPAAVEDTNAVFTWLTAHAGDYGVDMGRLFMVGDSAGGQLACQYAAMVTNPAYAALFGLEIPPIRFRAVALNCGQYRVRPEREWDVSSYATLGAYLGPDPDKFLPQMDTLSHITPAFPPAYVMTSQYDFLRDQAGPLCDVLKAQGVPYVYKCWGEEGQEHMAHVFHLNMRLKEADACNQEECEFFLNQI